MYTFLYGTDQKGVSRCGCKRAWNEHERRLFNVQKYRQNIRYETLSSHSIKNLPRVCIHTYIRMFISDSPTLFDVAWGHAVDFIRSDYGIQE